MAATCPINFDIAGLREEVRTTYERVARAPEGEFHFHRGPRYATEYLGYDAAELSRLPGIATARFSGVGNPLEMSPIRAGDVVLDHGCGSGTDLLLAAQRAWPGGLAIGVDMTRAMRECAHAAAIQAGLSSCVDVRAGLFEELPVANESIDVVISNGVVNLSPDKRQAFREVFRVLKPGGRFLLADVTVNRDLEIDLRSNPELWAGCVVGALPEAELQHLLREAGFVDCELQRRFDCFANTPAKAKVPPDLDVGGINVFARKPD